MRVSCNLHQLNSNGESATLCHFFPRPLLPISRYNFHKQSLWLCIYSIQQRYKHVIFNRKPCLIDKLSSLRMFANVTCYPTHWVPCDDSPSFQRNSIHHSADPTQTVFHVTCSTRFFSFAFFACTGALLHTFFHHMSIVYSCDWTIFSFGQFRVIVINRSTLQTCTKRSV